MPATTPGSDRPLASPTPLSSPPQPGIEAALPPDGTPVDSPEPRSVSFGPDAGAGSRGDGRPSASAGSTHEGHGFVAVGPGLPGALLLGAPTGLFGMNPLPVTAARIHRPLLRPDVLSRDRLNGWLEEATTGRLVLIVAEAGFGKTTLLADWSRHTARLTAWYRLEPDDRDWLTFLRHLVASGRELDPGFAADTFAMLRQLGPGGPAQQDVVAALVREIGEFADAHPEGLTLIFDDYHAVDRCEETEPIVRAILERTGPGFSVVIASRSRPHLPLGRLRARGGVARLHGDDLCFDVPEADRLFRDAYQQPLDPDVVASLIERTEGWPALLSLVHTNLEGGDAGQVRGLVRTLSGAAGEIYDFLADEIIERLPEPVIDFLMRMSIIDEFDAESGCIATLQSETEVAECLSAGEAFCLISRPDLGSPYRFLPVARDLLVARLEAHVGRDGIREAHRTVARRFDGQRWRLAATHYVRGGEHDRAARVIERSLDQILGDGQYRAAADLLSVADRGGTVKLVLQSRLLLQIGATQQAMDVGLAAVRLAEDEDAGHTALALQNAASLAIGARRYSDAADFARRASALATTEPVRDLSDAYVDIIEASGTRSLPALALRLENLLAAQLRDHQWHYAAITYLNLAQIVVWLDRAEEALRYASEAERLLERSSQGYEGVSIGLARAHSMAQLGRWSDAERLLITTLDTAHPEGQYEAALEAASLAAWFGPEDLSGQILERVSRDALPPTWSQHWSILDIWISHGDRQTAALRSLPREPPPTMEVGAAFRWHLAKARAYLHQGDAQQYERELGRADEVATSQQSPVQQRLAAVLRAVGHGSPATSRLLAGWPAADDAIASVFALEITCLLDELGEEALATVRRAADVLPHRWLNPLRAKLAEGTGPGPQRAATLVELIGEQQDIVRLREFSRRVRRSGAGWGGQLIQRLAPRVVVQDLGPISIRVGQRTVDGRLVRRKALALLAYLACQPRGIATPDQVVDALWPDQDPEQGTNSLHQTIYFLRRVIDGNYKAGLSAEYVRYEADVVSLDPTLVDCHSWQCRRLLSQRPETTSTVEAAIKLYAGPFAAEFAYEDWASSYRDNLHATYLSVVERAMKGAIGSPTATWRLWVGQQCLAVDPHADAIEAHMIRLYSESGAAAAAAEQYAHYSSVMKDELGVDPPSLDDVLAGG